MMRQVDGNGREAEADPALVAHFDQLEKRFSDLTGAVLELRGRIRQAAEQDDSAEIGACTKVMDELIKKEFPHPDPDLINYVMFLIDLVDQAHIWTDIQFEAVNFLARQLGAILPPGHPLHTLEGFDLKTLTEENWVAMKAIGRMNYMAKEGSEPPNSRPEEG